MGHSLSSHSGCHMAAAWWEGQSAGLGSNEEAGHEVGTIWSRRGRCDIEKGLSPRAAQEADLWKLVDRDSSGHRGMKDKDNICKGIGHKEVNRSGGN